jgi:hypothetical protein
MWTFSFWHSRLGMPKHDRAWHLQDQADEVQEWHEAAGVAAAWSELSDVVYTTTRAWWSGHRDIPFPLGSVRFLLGAAYMFPKYSLRWSFFRRVVADMGEAVDIREVRNPRKAEKLRGLAERYRLDPDAFVAACRRRLRWWPLLP